MTDVYIEQNGDDVSEAEIVSFSELYAWDVCNLQYYYQYTLELMPEELPAAMVTGILGHKLLQNFYTYRGQGMSKEEAHKLTTNHAQKLISSQSITEVTSLLTAWTLVDNYIRDNEFAAKAVIVEKRFLFPLSLLSDDPMFEDVQVGFTPDVVFERSNQLCDVEDAKFVSRAWSKKKLERFSQAKLYQIFLKKMGYKISTTRVRFFNVTTGKITRQDYVMGEAEERNLINDFVNGVREVLTYRRNYASHEVPPRRTMNYTACQFCSFELPCTLQAEGKDATKTLQHLYIKKDYSYAK